MPSGGLTPRRSSAVGITSERFQLRDDSRDLGIGEGDLAVVGMPLVLRRKRFGRPIRGVRVVKMDPREERLSLRAVDPRQRLVDDFICRPLDRRERHAARLAEIELVVIRVEALVDAPLGVEHVGADEPARAVAARLQRLGEGELLRPEEEAAVVAHAVLRRKLAREHARVHRQRERRHRHRLVEQHSFAREAIECRRLDILVAVRAHAIGARRIERHDDQVEPAARDAGRQRAEVDTAAALRPPRYE